MDRSAASNDLPVSVTKLTYALWASCSAAVASVSSIAASVMMPCKRSSTPPPEEERSYVGMSRAELDDVIDSWTEVPIIAKVAIVWTRRTTKCAASRQHQNVSCDVCARQKKRAPEYGHFAYSKKK